MAFHTSGARKTCDPIGTTRKKENLRLVAKTGGLQEEEDWYDRNGSIRQRLESTNREKQGRYGRLTIAQTDIRTTILAIEKFHKAMKNLLPRLTKRPWRSSWRQRLRWRRTRTWP